MATLHPMVRRIARALRVRCGAREGMHLLLAVSGGADSVAMLRSLHSLQARRRWNLTLTICHVHHHLRDQADDDAAFVAQLATSLGLDHVTCDIHPGLAGGNLEATARTQRYAALAAVARQRGCHAIVTAHHADDQLETLLMRLVRGTGVRGLAGIRWRRPMRGHRHTDNTTATQTNPTSATTAPSATPLMLLRPMLAVDRAAILDYLRDLGQPWCTDESNHDPLRWRARLRAEVMPVLRDLRQAASGQAVQLADHMTQLAHLLDVQVRGHEAVRSQEPSRWVLDRAACRAMHPVLLTTLLDHTLRELGCSGDQLTHSLLRSLARAVRDPRGGKRHFDLPARITATLTPHEFTFDCPRST